MGSTFTKCIDPPFVCITYGKKQKVLSKKQFLKCKRMEDIVRTAGFFPVARVVAMKTNEKGVFPWDSPTIYPELEITIEDLYSIKKTYRIEMIAVYRR